MKERPILFTAAMADMLRAILAGMATQTRRLVKGVSVDEFDGYTPLGVLLWSKASESTGERKLPCPYGAPGDRLWVRETWSDVSPLAGCDRTVAGVRSVGGQYETNAAGEGGVRYRASWDKCHSKRWHPSTNMPRWASRITLEITGVRVERLQSISLADAQAQGAQRRDGGPGGHGPHWSMRYPHPTDVNPADGYRHCLGSPQMAFAHLWSTINGLESWEANPLVWVVSFRRVS